MKATVPCARVPVSPGPSCPAVAPPAAFVSRFAAVCPVASITGPHLRISVKSWPCAQSMKFKKLIEMRVFVRVLTAESLSLRTPARPRLRARTCLLSPAVLTLPACSWARKGGRWTRTQLAFAGTWRRSPSWLWLCHRSPCSEKQPALLGSSERESGGRRPRNEILVPGGD